MIADRGSPQWMYIRTSLQIALHQAVQISRESPQHVFWLHAIRCSGCHRHAMALGLSTNTDGPKPKYTMYTIVNGEVIPRGLRH